MVDVVGDGETAGVEERRKPRIVVSIEVAEEQRLRVCSEIEDTSGVEAVSGSARGSRRDVAVVNIDGSVVDEGADSAYLEVGVDVGEMRHVEVGEADGVMNQNDESSAAPARAVLADNRVFAKVRIFG